MFESEKFKLYRKTAVQPMRPYVKGENMKGVSVANDDTPEVGGMIAVNLEDAKDIWYVSKKFFDSNYELI